MPYSSRSNSHGFTLVELLIIVPIVMLTITVFIGALIAMSTEVAKTQTENKLTYDTQYALDMIERDVRLSTNFLAGNEFSVASPLGYSDSTGAANSFTNNGPNGEMLILRGLTTDRNPLEPARELIYINSGSGCGDTQKIVANYYYSNIIYFTKTDSSGDKSLWRRTLLPTGTTCGTPWQRPSCNPAVTKTTACRADDVKLVDNVDDFTIEYLYSASSSSAVADAKDTSIGITTTGGRNEILRSTSAVRVSLTSARQAAGKKLTHNGVILTTRLNIPHESVGATP